MSIVNDFIIYDWLIDVTSITSITQITPEQWTSMAQGAAEMFCLLFDMEIKDDWTSMTARGNQYYIGYENEDFPRFHIQWSTQTNTNNQNWLAMEMLNKFGTTGTTSIIGNNINPSGNKLGVSGSRTSCIGFISINNKAAFAKQGFRYIKDSRSIVLYQPRYSTDEATLKNYMYQDTNMCDLMIFTVYRNGINYKMPLMKTNNSNDYGETFFLPNENYGMDVVRVIDRPTLNSGDCQYIFNINASKMVPVRRFEIELGESAGLYIFLDLQRSVSKWNNIYTINGKKYIIVAYASNGSNYTFGMLLRLID